VHSSEPELLTLEVKARKKRNLASWWYIRPFNLLRVLYFSWTALEKESLPDPVPPSTVCLMDNDAWYHHDPGPWIW
jgi:hypothetical protein